MKYRSNNGSLGTNCACLTLCIPLIIGFYYLVGMLISYCAEYFLDKHWDVWPCAGLALLVSIVLGWIGKAVKQSA